MSIPTTPPADSSVGLVPSLPPVQTPVCTAPICAYPCILHRPCAGSGPATAGVPVVVGPIPNVGPGVLSVVPPSSLYSAPPSSVSLRVPHAPTQIGNHWDVCLAYNEEFIVGEIIDCLCGDLEDFLEARAEAAGYSVDSDSDSSVRSPTPCFHS